MNARNVEKPSVTAVHFEAMKELRMERNLLNVSKVRKPSICPNPYKIT